MSVYRMRAIRMRNGKTKDDKRLSHWERVGEGSKQRPGQLLSSGSGHPRIECEVTNKKKNNK